MENDYQHPDITAAEATGYPVGTVDRPAICPICGEECDWIYYDKDDTIVGCDNCITERDAFEVPECFGEEE